MPVCGSFPDAENGMFYLVDRGAGTIALHCYPGYKAMSPTNKNTAVCQVDGQWIYDVSCVEDGTITPHPTPKERIIYISSGTTMAQAGFASISAIALFVLAL